MAAAAGDPSNDGSLDEGADSGDLSSLTAAPSPEADLSPDVLGSDVLGPIDALVLPFPSAPAAAAIVLASPASPAGCDAVDLTGVPGAGLVAVIAGLNPVMLPGHHILNGITALDRIISWVSGLQHSWLTAAARPDAVVSTDTAAAMAEMREGVDLDQLRGTAPDRVAALLHEHTLHLAAQELAPLLRMAHSTARDRITHAHDLVTNLPMIHEALLAGVLNPYRATLIANGTAVLAGPTRKLAAQILLNQGAALGIGKLKNLIKHTIATLDRAAFNELGEQARRDRDFQMFTDDHGMATIWAALPADQAILINAIIEELAEHQYKIQHHNPDIPIGSPHWRSQGQLRADTFADIMLTLATTGHLDLRDYLATNTGSSPATDNHNGNNGTSNNGNSTSNNGTTDNSTSNNGTTDNSTSNNGTSNNGTTDNGTDVDSRESPSNTADPLVTAAPLTNATPLIKPTGLNLTLTLDALLQLRNDPGYLHTFGFIPDHLRDAILKSASSVTVMLLDNCGTVLDLGKTVRFPNAALTRHLQQRDLTCRFPGCNNNAARADLDHQQPWQPPPEEPATSGRAQVSEISGSRTTTGRTTTSSTTTGSTTTGSRNNHAAGQTCPTNMAALCRTHHLMKHHAHWTVQHHQDHTLTWATPNGHHHSTTPHDWRLTLPAEHIAAAQQQLHAQQAAQESAEQAEIARIQAELDTKYPDEPPF